MLGEVPIETQTTSDASRLVGALIGVVTAAVAIGVAELAAGVAGAGTSPVLAVGSVTIDATPGWLKSFAIRTFGQSDKLVLITGIVVVLAVLAALLGMWSLRRPSVGVAGLAILGSAGAVAAVTRPAAGPGAAVPSILGALAGVVTFAVLRRAAGLGGIGRRTAADPGSTAEPAPDPPRIGGYDRRRFLAATLVAAGIAGVAGGVGRFLRTRADASASRDAVRLPAPAEPAPALPAGADLHLAGLSPFFTPNDAFYRVDTTLFVPAVDATTWSLRIHGMVDRDLQLDYSDLLSRPMVERDITIACVSNEVGGSYIGNARWLGTPLADLLREAGVRPGATQIVTRSSDGFTIGTPTAVVMDGRDALLAIGMNGEPLPLDHGFPVRMLVPGLYGYVSAMKWLVDLELTTFEAYDAYWVSRGWAQEAPIKTQSRIDTPKPSDTLAPGQVAVAGVAWAQHRGIDAVEVRVDDDAWSAADLSSEDTVDTWRQWVYRWDASPGRHTLSVRATDGDGEVQTAEPAEPFPDGATGYHTVTVDVA